MDQKVYIACPNSQEIQVFNLSCDGQLTLQQIVAVPGQVQPMVFSLNKRFLYVGIRPDFQILSYAINESGNLDLQGSASLPGSPTHLAIDNTGKYLLSASYSYNCVSVSPISSEGIVLEPITIANEINAPHSVNPIFSSSTLLIPALKEDAIRIFNFEQGKMIESASSFALAKGAGPRHMAFHNNHRIAYCINELDSTINTLALANSPEPSLQILQTLSTVPLDFNQTCWSADIHITPNNKFLYCCERSSSTITGFALDTEGLIQDTVGYFDTEKQPRGFAIDKTGNFLICTGQQTDTISLYKIDNSSGVLFERECHLIGKGAMWVLIK